ncbi:MAG: hypothetical protein ACYDGX_00525 [Thermoleophilia bacterium]
MNRNSCDQCGVCRECCIVEKLGGKAITTILSGDSETGAWNCANCWKCIESCPAGFDIYLAIIEHRRAEKAPASYREALDNICHYGYIFPMEEIDRIREMWGLPPVRRVDPKIIRKLTRKCQLIPPDNEDDDSSV